MPIFKLMIKLCILTIFLLNISYTQEDSKKYIKENTKEEFFLSKHEYGYELYKNPKGVSCQRCHGLYGRETLILTYTKKKYKKQIEKKIFAPNIRKLSFEVFLKRLSSNKPKKKNKMTIMPKYYLSYDEIFSIYNYLQNKE